MSDRAQSPFEPDPGLHEVVTVETIELRESPQHAVIGLQAVWPLAERSSELRLAHLGHDGAGDPRRDLVLQGEQILGDAVEMASPHHRAARCLGKLDGHAQPGSGPANAAEQGVPDAELAADLAHIDIRAPIADRELREMMSSSRSDASEPMMSSTIPSPK